MVPFTFTSAALVEVVVGVSEKEENLIIRWKQEHEIGVERYVKSVSTGLAESA